MGVKIGVVLPAAGTGQRIGSPVPKQLLLLDGCRLIIRTIQSFFEWNADIVTIVIPTAEEYIGILQMELPKEYRQKVVFVKGGPHRHYSIQAGLKELEVHDVDIVIAHDGVRPLLDCDLLNKLLSTAKDVGAAGPVTKLTSTVVSLEDDLLKDVLPRSQLRESQMPQVFRRDVIFQAYASATEEDLTHGTECLDLVRKYCPSIHVKLIEGNPEVLWKVTYKRDVSMALLSVPSTQLPDSAYFLYNYGRGNVIRFHKAVVGSVQCIIQANFTNVKITQFDKDLNSNDGHLPIVLHFSEGIEEFLNQVVTISASMSAFDKLSWPHILSIWVVKTHATAKSEIFGALEGIQRKVNSHGISSTSLVLLNDREDSDPLTSADGHNLRQLKRFLSLVLVNDIICNDQILFIQ